MGISDKYLGWLDSSWHAVLLTLQASPQSAALPTRAGCPHCRETALEVEPVLVAAGMPTYGKVYRIWTWCLKCEWSGDLIDMAAHTWQTDRLFAAARLNQLGFDIHIAEEADQVYRSIEYSDNRCKAFISLWKEAQRGMSSWAGNPKARQMMQHLELTGSYPEEWDRGLGPCAAITRVGVWGDLFPYAGKELSRDRIALVVPYWLAPGFPAGLNLFWWDGAETRNRFFRLNGWDWDSRAYKVRASLGAALIAGRSDWDIRARHVLVLNDALDSLRLYARLRKEGTSIPPVISVPRYSGYYPASIPDTFLRGRKVLVVTRQPLDLSTLASAFDVRAQVTSNVDIDRIGLSRLPAVEINELLNLGTSWEEAFRRLIRLDGIEALQAKVAALATSREDIDLLHTTMSTTQRRRLIERPPPKTALDGRLQERDGAWYYDKKLLSPAIVRISRLRAHTQPTPHIIASGNIVVDGKQIPFQDTLETLEARNYKWLRDSVMFSPETDVPYVIDAPFSMVDAALALYPPVKEMAAEYLGWSHDNNCWALPGFSIKRDGARSTTKISPVKYKGHPCAALFGGIHSAQDLSSLLNSEYLDLWSLVLAHVTCLADVFFGTKPSLFTFKTPYASEVAGFMEHLGLKEPEYLETEDHWTQFTWSRVNGQVQLSTHLETEGPRYELVSNTKWTASKKQVQIAGNAALMILEFWMKRSIHADSRDTPIDFSTRLIRDWVRDNGMSWSVILKAQRWTSV